MNADSRGRGKDLARRISREYGVSAPATWAELEAVCNAVGISVVVSDNMGGADQGVYVARPIPLILLRRGVGVRMLAHGLGVHLAGVDAAGDFAAELVA